MLARFHDGAVLSHSGSITNWPVAIRTVQSLGRKEMSTAKSNDGSVVEINTRVLFELNHVDMRIEFHFTCLAICGEAVFAA